MCPRQGEDLVALSGNRPGQGTNLICKIKSRFKSKTMCIKAGYVTVAASSATGEGWGQNLTAMVQESWVQPVWWLWKHLFLAALEGLGSAQRCQALICSPHRQCLRAPLQRALERVVRHKSCKWETGQAWPRASCSLGRHSCDSSLGLPLP